MKVYVSISTNIFVLFAAAVTAWSQDVAVGVADSTDNAEIVAADGARATDGETETTFDAAALAEVRAAEGHRIAAVNKAVQAAVAVFSPGGGGGGSGVVITPDGYALTNFHVVKPAGNYMHCGMADGRRYDAVLVGIDPTGDVALIKLLGRDDFPVAEIADSDQLRVGDWCFAVGNPFLLATDFKPTVTFGVVSGVHRYQYPAGTLLEYADCIQTDAAINPGNSGGPLFDSLGRLVGINGRGSFEKRGRVNVGVGYAISINQIQHFMGYLRSGRIVDHATLGATVRTSDEGRVVVQNILRGCDAFRRGLRYGDEIISFGNRDVTTVNGFKNVLGIYPRGWRVPLSYRRDGERFDVLVRLKGVHSPEQLIEAVQGPRAQPPGPGRPQPGDQPKPGDQDPKKPQRPMPPRPGQRPGRPKVVVPAEAKKLIETKRGYANYYFNRVLREKVLSKFLAVTGQDYPDSAWDIKGKFNENAEFGLELQTDFVTGRYPEGPDRIDLSKDLDSQLAPIGSHGMLASLHAWQRFLITGSKEFGDVYYLGTVPIAGHDQPCHVLIGTYNVLELRFIFEPNNGHLVAMEIFSTADIDPCELYFADFREVGNGRTLPHQIEVRVGLETFATLTVSDFVFADGSKSKPADTPPNPKVESDATGANTEPHATTTES